MPRASHRVDLLFVSRDIDRVPDEAAFAALRQAWTTRGLLARGGDGLIVGGFRALRLDLPGHRALYANQQGGYYVRCPLAGGGIAAAFSEAVQAWRRGGAFSVACPVCGTEHALSAVTLAPPGAFARGAVIFTDVGSLQVAPGVMEALEPVLGAALEVVRRVG